MTSPIKSRTRHEMPADSAVVNAKTQLDNLVNFINNVKDTARLRAKTDDSDPDKSTKFLHTRTGTVFGRLYKFITSNGEDAEIQRNLAKKLIEKVVNDALNGESDDTAKNIAKNINKILEKPNREFKINLTDKINLFSLKEKEFNISELKTNLKNLNDHLANKNINNSIKIDLNGKNYSTEYSEEYSYTSNETDSDGNDTDNRAETQVKLGNENIPDNDKSTHKIPQNISRSDSIKLINSGFNENNSKSEKLESNLLSKKELNDFDSNIEDLIISNSDVKNSEDIEIQNSPSKNSSQEIDEKEDEQPDFVSLTLLSNEINLSDEESKNESPNILNSSIEISEKVKVPNLQNENISQEIIQKKNGQLELVSVDELSEGKHGFLMIDKEFSITSFRTLDRIHADVYVVPKNFPLVFNEESLEIVPNEKAEKFSITRGTQEFLTGTRQYIKLKLDSPLGTNGTAPSQLDPKLKTKYVGDLVALYKSSLAEVMSLTNGQNDPIKTLAISPITFKPNIASSAEIRAINIAMKEIQTSYPSLFICIVTSVALKGRILRAMKNPT